MDTLTIITAVAISLVLSIILAFVLKRSGADSKAIVITVIISFILILAAYLLLKVYFHMF